jgi:hypothetical protein
MSPFPRELAWFTGCIISAAVIAALILLFSEGAPPLVPLVIFGLLVTATANLPVQLRQGVTVSPGLFVCMAAIVVFVADGSLLGAMLACSLMGCSVSDLRRGSWGWIPFNLGLSGIAFLAAAAVLAACDASRLSSTPLAALAMIPSALAYTGACWSLILLSYLCDGTRHPRNVIAELVPSAIDILPLGLLGFLVGRLYLALGPGILVLVVVPILIAREVFRSYTTVADAQDETVQMLIRALETKDRYTAGHAERVATYAGYIGKEIGLGPWRMERLHYGALMHDIGKLVVPNHILNKPGRLTESEFAAIRVHEKVAVQMLSHIDFLRPIAHSGHSDQMRFDAEDRDHPVEPYIIMIADAYDAMTSTRSYRKALTQDEAFEELRNKAGIQFHPECVEALIHALEQRGEVHGAGHEEHVEFADAPEAGVGSAGLGDLLPTE